MKQVDGDAARIQIWWNAMSNQITVSFLILDLENDNKFSTHIFHYSFFYYSYFQCHGKCCYSSDVLLYFFVNEPGCTDVYEYMCYVDS